VAVGQQYWPLPRRGQLRFRQDVLRQSAVRVSADMADAQRVSYAKLDNGCGSDPAGQTIAGQPHDVVFGPCQGCPSDVRAFALAAATLRVGDRLLGGQRRALGPGQCQSPALSSHRAVPQPTPLPCRGDCTSSNRGGAHFRWVSIRAARTAVQHEARHFDRIPTSSRGRGRAEQMRRFPSTYRFGALGDTTLRSGQHSAGGLQRRAACPGGRLPRRSSARRWGPG
jgi:hypothetical protein